MPSVAAPFVEMFQLAASGFSEGAAVLTEAQATGGEAARPMLAFGNQLMAGAFRQIEAAARRYLQANEAINERSPRLILNDTALRAAVEECATAMESAAPLLSVAGRRMPKVLRSWLDNPRDALVLASQADAAVRLAKTRAGRAA